MDRQVVMSFPSGGLNVRALDSTEIRPLANTQGARTPFWSPDSRAIGFFASADRTLNIVPALGGLRRRCVGRLAEAGAPPGTGTA